MRLKRYLKYNHSLEEIVENTELINDIKCMLMDGVALKVTHGISLDFLRYFKSKLKVDLNDHSYNPRVFGCENHRQVHWDHPSQIVPAKFLSWSYYPWNSDSKEIFTHLEKLFILRNLLGGLDKYEYLKKTDGIATARVAVQFYPSGLGYMATHQDPLNVHQIAIPTILLSDYGKNYSNGGFFALDENNKKVSLDEHLSFGDLTLFHTSIPHGVELIKHADIHRESNSIENGRLMLIAAVNSYASSEVKYDANVYKI